MNARHKKSGRFMRRKEIARREQASKLSKFLTEVTKNAPVSSRSGNSSNPDPPVDRHQDLAVEDTSTSDTSSSNGKSSRIKKNIYIYMLFLAVCFE